MSNGFWADFADGLADAQQNRTPRYNPAGDTPGYDTGYKQGSGQS